MTIYSLDVLLFLFGTSLLFHEAENSLMVQTVKCLPTVRETWVWSLGWEDLLEKEMATHSSILAWKIPWTEELGRPQSMGSQRVGYDWMTSLHFVVLCPVLTVDSWPAYRFLRRQVRRSGIPTSLRMFQFVVIHTVKGFSVVNETKVDIHHYDFQYKIQKSVSLKPIYLIYRIKRMGVIIFLKEIIQCSFWKYLM